MEQKPTHPHNPSSIVQATLLRSEPESHQQFVRVLIFENTSLIKWIDPSPPQGIYQFEVHQHGFVCVVISSHSEIMEQEHHSEKSDSTKAFELLRDRL